MEYPGKAESDATRAVAETAGKGIDLLQSVWDFVASFIGEPAEEFGGLIRDRIRFARRKRQIRFGRVLREMMEEEGGTYQAQIPMKLGMAIVEHASVEEDDTLQDMWARLFLRAADEETANKVHPAFATVLSQLDTSDAILLDYLYVKATTNPYTGRTPEPWFSPGPFSTEAVAYEIRELTSEQIEIAAGNLIRCNLLETRWENKWGPSVAGLHRAETLDQLREAVHELTDRHFFEDSWYLTQFGRDFIELVRKPNADDPGS